MSLFKKRDEILDLTELQRRGVLKKEEKQSNQEQAVDYLDLPQKQSSSSEEQKTESSAFNFLDSLAQASSIKESYGQAGQTSASDKSAPGVIDLKLRLEDLEYKLERFLERIGELELRIKDLEKY